MKNIAALILIIVFSIVSVFSQDSLESLTKAIEENPNTAGNYLKRADIYSEMWQKDRTNLELAAFATADLSKYISLNPNDEEAYRKRAMAREILFLGANPFSIADYKEVIRLTLNDSEAKGALAAMEKQYKTMFQSKECVNYRRKNGFQGDASEPMTILTEFLDSSMDDGQNFDSKGLKGIACGADVNYFYKKDDRRPQFDDAIWIKTIHIIALLEAGAKTENKNKFGNTVLMMTLQRYIEEKGNISDKENLIKKLKILLLYGANVNAKNLKGQSVMSLAKKTGNKEIIDLLETGVEKTFDGTWGFDDGRRFGLSVQIKEVKGKLTGDYENYSSKQSVGKILSSKINGNTAIIEIDCDWGGKGTVQITRLKGNKLHWKVIKRDEKDGDFIVLVDQILAKK